MAQTFRFNMGHQQESMRLTPEQEKYNFNSILLDIYNNWDAINDLMFQYVNGLLKKINQWDKEWLTFIQHHHIKLEEYEDKEIFLESNWKSK